MEILQEELTKRELSVRIFSMEDAIQLLNSKSGEKTIL